MPVDPLDVLVRSNAGFVLEGSPFRVAPVPVDAFPLLDAGFVIGPTDSSSIRPGARSQGAPDYLVVGQLHPGPGYCSFEVAGNGGSGSRIFFVVHHGRGTMPEGNYRLDYPGLKQ